MYVSVKINKKRINGRLNHNVFLYAQSMMTTSMQATVHLQDTVCHASCRPLSSIEPVFQSHITNSDPLFVLITTGEDVEVNENQQV